MSLLKKPERPRGKTRGYKKHHFRSINRDGLVEAGLQVPAGLVAEMREE
jgi:hypothetical protein